MILTSNNEITIKNAIDHIDENKFVLPAIQREYVWTADQIEELFDSIMSRYPISTFLMWEVSKTVLSDSRFKFYKFLNRFHQENNVHNEELRTEGKTELIAILDGQQRLTSIFIGLKGSYATKIKHKRAGMDKNYPEKRLYLNLLYSKPEESKTNYEFKFLTKSEATTSSNKSAFWFEISKILDIDENEINKFFRDHLKEPICSVIGADDNEIFDKITTLLKQLHDVVHREKLIPIVVRKDESIDDVLEIFVRCNSGGTKLNHSDLLLSMATAEWKNRDARRDFIGLVSDLNKKGQKFNFNKDFVLKTFLCICSKDIRFEVKNFSSDVLTKMEDQFESIRKSIFSAVDLLVEFGYNSENLSSLNAVIPIVLYLHKNQIDSSYIKSEKFSENKENIRVWLTRSLIKQVFSGQSDTIISTLSKTINDSQKDFPVAAIEKTLIEHKKSIVITDEDISLFMDYEYGEKRTYSLLTLLYAHLNHSVSNYDEDHIFPKSKFKDKSLADLKLGDAELDYFKNEFNKISNIQLLEADLNKRKLDADYDDWLSKTYKTDSALASYKTAHFIPNLDSYSINQFMKFNEDRKKILKEKLRGLLIADRDRT